MRDILRQLGECWFRATDMICNSPVRCPGVAGSEYNLGPRGNPPTKTTLRTKKTNSNVWRVVHITEQITTFDLSIQVSDESS